MFFLIRGIIRYFKRRKQQGSWSAAARRLRASAYGEEVRGGASHRRVMFHGG